MIERRGHAAGFTLLEVLVALVVLGLLLGGLTQGVRFGLAAWDRQNQAIDRTRDRDAVDLALRNLVEQLEPAVQVDGRAHSLGFTSVLPVAADLPTHQADLLLLVDTRHRLLLRWRPHLHAERFVPAPPPQETVLTEGVAALNLAYWPRTGNGAWLDSWTATTPPALIRFRLSFLAADRRHWADIVAVPMRDPATP
jgi:general secretion pathway protein J